MQKQVFSVFMDNLDQKYSHKKTIEQRPGEKQTKKRKHTDHKYYRAFTYCAQSLRIKDERKIKKQIEKYSSIESKHLTVISECNITSFGESSEIIILTKYNNKTLRNSMKSQQQALNSTEILSYMRQLALGVKLLHQNELTHNRISLGRIEICNKKCVLGLPFFSSIEHLQKRQGILNLQKDRESQEGIYLAPELFEGWYCSQASDVWALGVTFLQMALGKSLQKTQLNSMKSNPVIQQIEKVQNAGIKQLLKRMLSFKKENRISIGDVANFLLFNSELKIVEQPQTTLSLSLTNLFPFEKFRHNKNQFILSSKKLKPFFHDQRFTCLEALPEEQIWAQSDLIVSAKLDTEGEVLVVKAISDFDLEQLAKLRLGEVMNIIQLLEKNKFCLKITQSGDVVVEISQKQVIKSNSNLPKPSKLERADRCITTIANQRGETVQGLLIGQKLLLTSASFNSQSSIEGILTVNCHMKGVVCEKIQSLSFYLFDQYKLKKLNEPNCAVVELNKIIYRQRYMTMVSNYSEEQTYRKLKEMKRKVQFHYQAGGHEAFQSDSLIFSPNKRFIIRSKASDKIKKGCPLLVVFTHNQCYAIGMFQSAQKGYLFGDSFYWFIWNCVLKQLQNENCGAHRGSTKMMEWQNVHLDQLQPLYSHVLPNFLSFEDISDYLLEDSPYEWRVLSEQIIRLRKEQIFLNKQLQRQLSISQKIIKLYQKIYGHESQALSIELFFMQVVISNNMSDLDSSKLSSLIEKIEKAGELESKHKRNMSIYIESWLKVAQYSNVACKLISLDNTYENKVIEGLIKCQEIIDYIDHKATLENYHFLMINHYFARQNNLFQAKQHCQKYLHAVKGNQIKEANMMWQACVINRVIKNFRQALTYLKGSFEILTRLSGNKSKNSLQLQKIKPHILTQWQNFNQIILSLNQVGRDIIEEYIEITRRFVPDKAINIVSALQSKLQNMPRN